MAFDKNDFVISYKSNSAGHLIITAHNKSSISITNVKVNYTLSEKGEVTYKFDEVTQDISPGETRRILDRNASFSTVQVTEITVQASDGTVFNVPPPPIYSASNMAQIGTGLCCITGAILMGWFRIDQFYTGSTSHLYKGDLDKLYVDLGVWTVLPILIGLAMIVWGKRTH